MSSITFNQSASTNGVRRQLETSTRSLARVFERLSSGQRINRASDDAAGLAVYTSLNLKSAVYSKALRNVSDATSLFSIHEQALASLSDIVTRQLELAQQSANGVFSEVQRSALDKEAEALSWEYSRILNSTSFNGINLLNGAQDSLSIQAGIGAETTLNLKIRDEGLFLTNLTQQLSMGGTADAFSSEVRFLTFKGNDNKDTLLAVSVVSASGRAALRFESFRVDGSGNLQLVNSRVFNSGITTGSLNSATFKIDRTGDTFGGGFGGGGSLEFAVTFLLNDPLFGPSKFNFSSSVSNSGFIDPLVSG